MRLSADQPLPARAGEAGRDQLFNTTIEAAVKTRAVKKLELKRLMVDTTLRKKATAHPTDSRLLDTARDGVVRLDKRADIQPKQTDEYEGATLPRPARGYAHVEKLTRLLWLGDEPGTELETWEQHPERIHRQRPKAKSKLFALYAP